MNDCKGNKMLACIIKQARSKFFIFINIEFCLYLLLYSSLKLWNAVTEELDAPTLLKKTNKQKKTLNYCLVCSAVMEQIKKMGKILVMGILMNEYIFVWIKAPRTHRAAPVNVLTNTPPPASHPEENS